MRVTRRVGRGLGSSGAEPPKRVLVLVSHDVMIYNTRKEIVTELLEAGYDVMLAYPGGRRVQYFVERGAEFTEITYDRHSTNPAADIVLTAKYLKLMHRYDPDVVLTFSIKPNIYGGIAARILGIPCVANVTGVGSTFVDRGLVHQVVVLLYRIAFAQARTVFVQNQLNLELLQNAGIRTRKYHVLPGSGVNLEEFRATDYPVQGEGFRLLYLGRIQRDKGILELCAAARKLHDDEVPVQFEVAGFVDDESAIGEFNELVDEGIIKYHGNVDDVRPLIEQASAVIHPSHHEGMANVLLEAAAMGRPVLASDIPGCRETFDDHLTGISFEPSNVESLQNAVLEFLTMDYAERAQMGLKGRQKVEREFNRQIVVNTYLDEVLRLVGPARQTTASSEKAEK